jgi:hypothetical protein
VRCIAWWKANLTNRRRKVRPIWQTTQTYGTDNSLPGSELQQISSDYAATCALRRAGDGRAQAPKWTVR